MPLVKLQSAPARSFFDFRYPQFNTAATQPAVNIVETAQGYRIELAAPGLDKSDFHIKVESGVLTISAQKEVQASENGAQYRRREFAFSSFERSFRLPATVDAQAVSARFSNGILLVDLNKKAEAQPLVKTIEVG